MTSMSATVLMSETNPCRTTAWSSTTTMRIFSLLILVYLIRSGLNRHAHRHLGARAGLALDRGRAAHLLGALAHADEAEVSAFAPVVGGGVEAAPVVFDFEPHLARAEVQAHRDGLRLRVADGVADGLLPDAQEVVLDLRRERAERAADRELRLHAALGRQPPRHLGERRRQVALVQRLGPQVPDVAARLGDAAADEGAGAVEVLARGVGRRGHRARDDLQLHGDAEYLLREVVVYLARDAVALLEHRAVARPHPPEPQRVKLPREEPQADDDERVEPVGAIEVRPEPEAERGGLARPDAVVVAGDDQEAVRARPQVRVIGHAPVAAVNPILVEAFELVAVAHLLRRDEAEARVVEVEAAPARRQAQVGRRRHRLAVDAHLLDDGGRRLRVGGHVLGVDGRDALDGREPEAPRVVAPRRGVAAAAALARAHAVGRPVDDRVECARAPGGELF